MSRKSTLPLVSVLVIVFFACVDGRNLVSLPWNGQQGDFSLSLDDIPIIKEVTDYSSIKDPPPSMMCGACLDVSEAAERFLSDSKLPDKIVSISSLFCDFLTPDMQSKCVDRAKDHTGHIISYLKDVFRKENLCYGTGLCSSNAEKSQDLSLNGFSLKLSYDRTCANCHSAIEAIVYGLNDPKTEYKIVKLLKKTCKEFDDRIPHCEELVYEYAPIVLHRLQNYLRNNDVCVSMQFCNNAPTQPQMAIGA